MLFSASPLILSLLPLALAQYGSPDQESSTTKSATPAAATSPSSSGTIHKVTVGANNQLAFSPNSFTAAIGDSIEFHFFPPAHSVVRSSFTQPCAPVNASAFFSGPTTTTSGENKNVFTVKVNTTDPIWFYCGFPGHCQAGMAGVVNPPAGETIAQYISAAANAPTTKTPANVQGGILGAAITASSTTSSSASSSPSPTASGNSGMESKGGVHWVLFGFTGMAAVAVGSMMA